MNHKPESAPSPETIQTPQAERTNESFVDATFNEASRAETLFNKSQDRMSSSSVDEARKIESEMDSLKKQVLSGTESNKIKKEEERSFQPTIEDGMSRGEASKHIRGLLDRYLSIKPGTPEHESLRKDLRRFAAAMHPDKQSDAEMQEIAPLANELLDASKRPNTMSATQLERFFQQLDLLNPRKINQTPPPLPGNRQRPAEYSNETPPPLPGEKLKRWIDNLAPPIPGQKWPQYIESLTPPFQDQKWKQWLDNLAPPIPGQNWNQWKDKLAPPIPNPRQKHNPTK